MKTIKESIRTIHEYFTAFGNLMDLMTPAHTRAALKVSRIIKDVLEPTNMAMSKTRRLISELQLDADEVSKLSYKALALKCREWLAGDHMTLSKLDLTKSMDKAAAESLEGRIASLNKLAKLALALDADLDTEIAVTIEPLEYALIEDLEDHTPRMIDLCGPFITDSAWDVESEEVT